MKLNRNKVNDAIPAIMNINKNTWKEFRKNCYNKGLSTVDVLKLFIERFNNIKDIKFLIEGYYAEKEKEKTL
jgi:hypothetical protein